MTSIGTSVTRALLVVALSSTLAGCGNKGPLVLPPPAEAPAVPPAATAPTPSDAVPVDAAGDDVLGVDGDAGADADADAQDAAATPPPPRNG